MGMSELDGAAARSVAVCALWRPLGLVLFLELKSILSKGVARSPPLPLSPPSPPSNEAQYA
jgi:hypothetical protein